jgi:excisionase family DNA binding protein
MSKLDLIEKAKASLVDLLDDFKTDLVAEVRKSMKEELSTTRSIAASPDQTLTRIEAAKLLNCSFTTLCHYQKEGVIPFYKVGKKVLFKREEVLAAIRRQVKKNRSHEKQA